MRRSITDAQRNIAALKMKKEVLEPPRIDPKYFVSETDAYVSDSLQISLQKYKWLSDKHQTH